MRRVLFVFAALIVPFAAHAADLKGKWLTDAGKGHVLFQPCGAKMCGKIVWLREPKDKDGKPLVDALNKNESLRTRPILGMKLTELEADGNGGWKGSIYNPEDGKSYNATASVDGSTLRIKGCV